MAALTNGIGQTEWLHRRMQIDTYLSIILQLTQCQMHQGTHHNTRYTSPSRSVGREKL